MRSPKLFWVRRSAALLAVLAAVAVGWFVVAVRSGGGDAAPSIAAGRQPGGIEIQHTRLRSRALGRGIPVTFAVPPGRPDGLVLFLHGRGGTARSGPTPAFLAALRRLGSRAPVVVFPDGARDRYWHDRDSGRWGGWINEDIVPMLLKRFDVPAAQVAIGGISMGGFGAADLARLAPGRYCAVGLHSPALWTQAGETAPGAFDDAADFARHDVILAARTQPAAFRGPRWWIDAGREDPFVPGQRAFTQALRATGVAVTARSWPGGHTGRYWSAHWPDYLRFYSSAIADCG